MESYLPAQSWNAFCPRKRAWRRRPYACRWRYRSTGAACWRFAQRRRRQPARLGDSRYFAYLSSWWSLETRAPSYCSCGSCGRRSGSWIRCRWGATCRKSDFWRKMIRRIHGTTFSGFGRFTSAFSCPPCRLPYPLQYPKVTRLPVHSCGCPLLSGSYLNLFMFKIKGTFNYHLEIDC